MPRLDVFDIRRKPQFFTWHTECLGCDYHIEKEERSLRIYAEYNIICEAQYLYLFELVKGPNGFTLKFFSESFGNTDVDAEFIRNDKEEAIEAVRDKILKETALGEEWAKRRVAEAGDDLKKRASRQDEADNYLKQEAELKVILRQKLEEFIG